AAAVACTAGSSGRADVPGHAEALDRHITAAETRHGTVADAVGEVGGADRLPYPGQLDHRQLFLAVDLLHQRADRHLRQRGGREPAAREARTAGTTAGGLRGPDH